LYSFRLTYAPNGAIVSSQDSVNGNWTYSYDALDRLVGARRPGRALSYDYDRNGNRWRQNSLDLQAPSRQYGFDASSNRIVGFTYDALGNVIFDGAHRYAYDAENRLITVDGGATAVYAYDALSRRVRRDTSGTATEYLYDLSGRVVSTRDANTGSWRSGEVYVADRHLATYANGTTYFHHRDWLGSNRLTTLSHGTMTEQCTDLPFGDGLACSPAGQPPTSTPFAQYERDAESQLDHTWFRQYSSAQGRWTTPDPYLGSIDTTNPQSLNRYAYVTNDPISLHDPLGLYQGCTFQNETFTDEDDKNITPEKCRKQGGIWGEIITVPGSYPRVDPVPIIPPSFKPIPYLPPGFGGGGISRMYLEPIGPQKPTPSPDDLCDDASGPVPTPVVHIPTIEDLIKLAPLDRTPTMSAAPRDVPTISAAKSRPHLSESEVLRRTYNCTLAANSVFFQAATWIACREEAESGRMFSEIEESPHVEYFEIRRPVPPALCRFPPNVGGARR
jgi:RHS repeat-associated protein